MSSKPETIAEYWKKRENVPVLSGKRVRMPSKKQFVIYEQADTTIPPDNTTKSNSKERRRAERAVPAGGASEPGGDATGEPVPEANMKAAVVGRSVQSEPVGGDVPASQGGDTAGEPVPEANMKEAVVGRSVQSEPAGGDAPASQGGDTMKEAVVGQSGQTEPAGVDVPVSQGDDTAVNPVPEANMKESVVELDDDFEPIDLEAFEDQLKESVSVSTSTLSTTSPQGQPITDQPNITKPQPKGKKPEYVMTHLGSLQVPPNNKAKSFQDYVDLPITDSHCQSVERPHCHGWPCKKSKSVDRIALLRERKKKGQILSKLEEKLLKDANKGSEKSLLFFMTKKPPLISTSPIAKSPLDSSDDANTAVAKAEADTTSEAVKSDYTRKSCEGIYPDYKKKEFQELLNAYTLHATISEKAVCEPRLVGNTGLTNFFLKTCNGDGVYRKTKIGIIHSCDECHNSFYCNGQRAKSLKANIKDRGRTFTTVHTILRRSDIAPEDQRILSTFNNTSDEYLTLCGRDLRTLNKPSVKAVVSQNDFLPGGDKFINGFVKTYQDNKEVRDHLLVGLMQAYIAKVNGIKTPVYGTAVTNFYLSLSGCGSKSALQFASANLGKCISMRHIQRLAASKRPPPFIQHTRDDVVDIILSHIATIRSKFGDDTLRIAFSVGIDATKLVQCWQFSTTHCALVGGCYPNHMVSLEGKGKEEIEKLIQEHREGKHGPLAEEVKVAVLTFQAVPPGMSPMFVLCGKPQGNNESSDYTFDVLRSCEMAAARDGNACVLDISTDGVSCDVEKNLRMNLDYLEGKCNTVAMTDNKHNNKNARGQAVTGSSPSSLGSFVLDPWHLKQAGVARELYAVQDWASDTVVTRLCSASTVLKLLSKDFKDVGNLAVLVVNLTLIRLETTLSMQEI
ncbi:hypothetical protein HJC23_006493 [Cyclotella cryptica]|uniref:Uncharacterized protein n=1 Tax=Cyclotella cryptica TaxID=29204 RepID=A0ABD3PMR0_9STRA